MSTKALREILEFIPCTHLKGCVHCRAVAEVEAIERAARSVIHMSMTSADVITLRDIAEQGS